jgi:hypothetical protein
MTRRKLFGNLCGRPVISVIWRVRVSDVINILVNGMNVGLGESETKRYDRRGVVPVRMRPPSRDMIALLMKKQREVGRLGDRQPKNTEGKEQEC